MNDSAGGALVTVHDLHKSYGQVTAVRGVSFEVRRGEVFGLLGPNGAGKTTILETVEGMLPIDRGRVTVDGVDVSRHPERVPLADLASRPVKTLSGGQQQRFAVAVALVNDPPLLFLDEPTTGLDPQARRSLWELVRFLRLEGRAVVLTTHYMDEAQELCDRVAIMDAGTILALDAPARLVEQLLATGFRREVAVQAADLEDVFLRLTGRQLTEAR